METTTTLLIVDDSLVSRMITMKIISQLSPEWELLEAPDGKSALEICQTHSIDFFSIDLNMPGMDGFQLIELIKPNHPHSKIALLTANIQDSTQKKAHALGATCITKPITEESMRHMIKAFS